LQKKELISYQGWLKEALQSADGDVTWTKTWSRHHGGGTSRVPHLRPWIQQATNGDYQALLSTSSSSPRPNLLEKITIVAQKGSTAPRSHQIFQALLDDVNEMLKQLEEKAGVETEL